jgi:hypothetical protein
MRPVVAAAAPRWSGGLQRGAYRRLGTQLRESIEVRVVEESAETIYLVIPSASPLGQGSELSDEELDAVAGGFSYEDTSATICSFPPCF